MEELLYLKESHKTITSLKLINLTHPKLKKITTANKKIILCFINNIKLNLPTLRHLRQLSYRLHYELVLIHLEEDNLSEQHFITTTIHDRTGEIFDKYNVGYNYQKMHRFTNNFEMYRKSGIFIIISNQIQNFKLYPLKIDLQLFPTLIKFEDEMELNLIMNSDYFVSNGSSSNDTGSTNNSTGTSTSTSTSTSSSTTRDRINSTMLNPFKLKKRQTERKSLDFKSILKNDDKKTEFKNYLVEISQDNLNRFFFLERYVEYKKIMNMEERKLFESKLYEDFLSGNGIYHLNDLQNDLLKKVEMSYQIDSPSIGLKLIYKDIFDNMNYLFKQFWGLKEGPIVEDESPPKTFEDLINRNETKKLFSSFVIHHFGKYYIECFDDLIEYNDKKSLELLKKIQNYCLITSDENIILNAKFRSKIVDINQKFRDNWYDLLFKFVFDILSNEYYPRFINSKSWKNYLNLNYSKDKKLFEDVYIIKKIVKETESFFETTQILTVQNKLTNETFTGKRVFFAATKNSNEKKFLDFVEHKNILSFIEYFTNDSTNQFNKKSTTIITTKIDKSLKILLEKQNEKFTNKDIVEYLKQMLLAIREFHKKSIHFKFGELTEESIYLSIYNSIQIDPGIYTPNISEEENLENCPPYLVPPEKKISSKSDIFTIGMIIFRLMTIYSSEEMQKIHFVSKLISSPKSESSPKILKSPKESPQSKSPIFSTRNSLSSFSIQTSSLSKNGSILASPRSNSVLQSPRTISSKRISSFFSNALKKPKIYDYYENIKNLFSEYQDESMYDEKLLQIVLQMIDSNPDSRPDVDELLEKLSTIKILLRTISKKKSSKFEGLDDQLKNLIKNDNQRPYLKEFLRTEFAVETILFLEDCKRFRQVHTDQERFDKAEEMCQSYIHDNSPLEINLSAGTKLCFFNDFEDAKHTGMINSFLFDDMEEHVIDTIMVDSLPRFEKSAIGKELFEKNNSF
eukprot:gene11365-4533_t